MQSANEDSAVKNQSIHLNFVSFKKLKITYQYNNDISKTLCNRFIVVF